MAGVVLIADTKLIVAERDPACFAAPAGVDQALAVGKQGGERSARMGSAIGEELRREDEGVRDGNGDQVSHEECRLWWARMVNAALPHVDVRKVGVRINQRCSLTTRQPAR